MPFFEKENYFNDFVFFFSIFTWITFQYIEFFNDYYFVCYFNLPHEQLIIKTAKVCIFSFLIFFFISYLFPFFIGNDNNDNNHIHVIEGINRYGDICTTILCIFQRFCLVYLIVWCIFHGFCLINDLMYFSHYLIVWCHLLL